MGHYDEEGGAFHRYSEEHIHFLDDVVSPLLQRALSVARQSDRPLSLLDLGCGDGALPFALRSRGLIGGSDRVVGVDLSPVRCRAFEANVPGAAAVCADACHVTALEDRQFDLILSNQVIEHVEDDREYLAECRRLLRGRGYLFLTTVVKRWYGLYIYRNNGRVVIDPTHRREYPSSSALVELLEKAGLEMVDHHLFGIRFPITDLMIRLFLKLRLLRSGSAARNLYLRHRRVRQLRQKLLLPIPGYFFFEAICRRPGAP